MPLTHCPSLASYGEAYASVNDSEGLPMRVVAELAANAPLAAYDPIHLDNLLAWAVLREATGGQMVPPIPGAYCLPVPLRRLWESADGLPLWASSCFLPASELPSVGDTAYLHKRAITGAWSAGNARTGVLTISTAKGRHMERRVPIPVTVCARWEAWAWGDPAETLRLLVENVAFLGKRRGAGFGEVRRWHVLPGVPSLTSPLAVLIQEGKLTRPVPVGAASHLGLAMEEPPSPIGWTPPQWRAALFDDGWASGSAGAGNWESITPG